MPVIVHRMYIDVVFVRPPWHKATVTFAMSASASPV